MRTLREMQEIAAGKLVLAEEPHRSFWLEKVAELSDMDRYGKGVHKVPESEA